ncbi:hypothetical protein D8S78_05790 [Natrialba swarupiae]|nr:hypothetical protein [Natrialba swarupiae]
MTTAVAARTARSRRTESRSDPVYERPTLPVALAFPGDRPRLVERVQRSLLAGLAQIHVPSVAIGADTSDRGLSPVAGVVDDQPAIG